MEKMTVKNNKSGFFTLAIVLPVIFSVFLFGAVNIAKADCALTEAEVSGAFYNNQITAYMVKTDISHVQTTVINNTNCSFSASVASAKVYDNLLKGGIPQTQISTSEHIISAHSSHVFTSSLASCLTQVDLWSGQVGMLGKIYGLDGRVFGDIPSAQGIFCTQDNSPAPTVVNGVCGKANGVSVTSAPTTKLCSAGTKSAVSGSGPWSWTCTGSGTGHTNASCSAPVASVTPTLTGSCSANPASANIGSSITWTVAPSGGTGSYAYSWSGTDSLTGSSITVSKSYSTSGTKSATVTITSGSQSIPVSCSASVNTAAVNDLAVSCSVSQSTADIGNNVTWYSSASGGNGSYSYDWSGPEGLSGTSRNITWSFDNSGTKRATVTVTSNGQTADATCSTRINSNNNNNLNVSCYASPSSPQIGSRMYWYVDVFGGDGDYNYDWSGTDGLNSSNRTPSMTYYNSGTKRATVDVTDGNGNEDIATCDASVQNNNSVLAFSQVNQTPLESAVYLSQVPYTGLADNLPLYFFIGTLALFSAYISYAVISYKKNSITAQ